MDRPRRSLAVTAALALAMVAVEVAAPASALAERTLHVTTTRDLGEGPSDPGACATGGECSLRQAVNAARGQDTTVVVPAGHYRLTNGELQVAQHAGTLTLAGAGAGQTRVEQETPVSRVANVHTDGHVVISGMTFTGGDFVGPDGADGADEQPGFPAMSGVPGQAAEGGGIYTTGDLTLVDVVVSGNAVTGGAGGDGGDGGEGPGAAGGPGAWAGAGGIFANGRLRLERVRVSGNRVTGGAAGDGGGVRPDGAALTGGVAGVGGPGFGAGVHLAGGSLEIVDSWLEGNVATGGAGGLSRIVPRTPPDQPGALVSPSGTGEGGGLSATAGSLALSGSTVSGNVAAGGAPPAGHAAPARALGRGGGLYLTVPFTAVRSTIAANVAGGSELAGSVAEGGGIWTSAGGALTATTVAANVAEAGSAAETGGNVRAGGASSLWLRGSLVAGGDAATGANCAGDAVGDVGGNVQGGVTAQCAGTLVADAGIRALAGNGGPTPTVALAAGSAAIDAGVCADGMGLPLATDQRGLPRPVGGVCDAGAYELQPTPDPPPGEDGRREPLPPPGDGPQPPSDAPGDARPPGGKPAGSDGPARAGVAPRVRFRLARSATVTVRVQSLGRGPRVDGVVRLGRRARGVNVVRLPARIGRRLLAPGRYRVTVTARSAGRSRQVLRTTVTVRRR